MNIRKWDKKPISEPGIYSGVPMSVYHGPDLCDGPSVSSSGLRAIYNKSPAHYWCGSPYNPGRLDDGDETDTLILGRAAHHLLLGEDDFNEHYVMRPEKFDSWRTNAAKEWRAGQEAEGRTVLINKQIDAIRYMARSLAAHPLVERGILNGAIEQTLVWKCRETGVWIKARPDAIPNDSGDFADLKTTQSVRRDDIARSIASYGYHQQAALILAGWKELTGRDAESFSFVFVESKPPCCVSIVTLKEDDIARGMKQNASAIKKFAHGIATGEWPGPAESDAEYISLPAWEQGRIDFQLEMEEKLNG